MTDVLTNLSVSINPNEAVSGLDRVLSSYNRLVTSSDKYKNTINRHFKSLGKGFKTVGNTITKTVNFISKSLSNLATQIAIVFGFSELVDAARKIEKFETTFLTFTGTLKLARKEINTLLAVTNKFGVSFEAAIIPFAKFAAATQDMAKSDIRNIFTSFIEASSALQLNMQEVNGVFLALQQIASKGRVSMEELRLQLAERIPGTMIIAANAMKMTMMEFEKAARTGAINVNEFLLKFSEGIHQKFGPAAELAANRLFAKMNRLNNAMIFFKERLFTTGVTGEAYSRILEDITNKLNNNEMATGAISNILGSMLEKIEAFVTGTTVEDINKWIDSFSVLTKTIGIAVKATWNLSTAIFKVGTESTSTGKLLRWPFDLAAAFDLARDGLLEFKDIMAASSFTELHTLVADVMTTDQELQKLRVTYSKLEERLDKLQSKMLKFTFFPKSKVGLKQDILATQELLYETQLLIEKKEKLSGLKAMKMDPQLKALKNQYKELDGLLSKLQSKILAVRKSGPDAAKGFFGSRLSDEIRQTQDRLHAIQLLIDKRKEYFGVKFDKTGKEIDEPTKVIQPPDMREIERAHRFIEKTNKLMQRGYDNLLSDHDKTIKHILDTYNEFHTKIQSYVSEDPTLPGILTPDEADRYISEMQKYTQVMYNHAMANKKVSSELTIFNSALQTAKDSLLPEYEMGIKRITDEYDNLNILAKSAAKVEGWDTTQLTVKLDEIKELRESALFAYDEEMSIKELSDIELKNQAYINLYNDMDILTREAYKILRSQYLADMQSFALATGNKLLAYKIYVDQMVELDAQMFEDKEKTLGMSDKVMQGMTDGLDVYMKKANDVSSQVETMMVSALQNMEDALVNFCISGKLNFKDFAKSVIKDILRIIVKQLILNAVMSAVSSFSIGSGAGAGAPSAGSVAPAGASTPTTGVGQSPQLMAKGGIFSSPGLSTYSGQIVNSPTHFAFARGMGLMGEAGPEAIMPLSRMPGGDLGVKVEAESKSQVPMQVHIHEAPGTQTHVKQSDDGQNLEITIEQVEQAITGRMERGTGMSSFMDSRYGRTY